MTNPELQAAAREIADTHDLDCDELFTAIVALVEQGQREALHLINAHIRDDRQGNPLDPDLARYVRNRLALQPKEQPDAK